MVSFRLPRMVVAGLAGSTGKTLVALGLARALTRSGLRVAAFKKGPDYIDGAWLGIATGNTVHNLDTFLMSHTALLAALEDAAGADFAVIEGNRGLFDGVDVQGTHSTAELAHRVQAPVVLVVDVSKATRTVAALVLGCLAMDPGLPLAGIILNRVGTSRQERLIREVLATVTAVPVLGAIPRLELELPSRHLGLVMPGERQDIEGVLDRLADAVAGGVDLAAIRRLGEGAPSLPRTPRGAEPSNPQESRLRIGVLRDAACCFYYPENLAALSAQGADIVSLSPLTDPELPALDALYIGGGYPEEHAPRLSSNLSFRSSLLSRIREGLPVWAECGGLMYLAEALVVRGEHYPMVGALPIVVEQTARPQAHGYVEARVDVDNPYLPAGTHLRGHEFHFSRIATVEPELRTVLALDRGLGIGGGRDGLVAHRIFASYLHLFAPGTPEWAPAFARVAREARAERARTWTDKGEHHGKHRGGRRHDRNRRGWLHPGA